MPEALFIRVCLWCLHLAWLGKVTCVLHHGQNIKCSLVLGPVFATPSPSLVTTGTLSNSADKEAEHSLGDKVRIWWFFGQLNITPNFHMLSWQGFGYWYLLLLKIFAVLFLLNSWSNNLHVIHNFHFGISYLEIYTMRWSLTSSPSSLVKPHPQQQEPRPSVLTLMLPVAVVGCVSFSLSLSLLHISRVRLIVS